MTQEALKLALEEIQKYEKETGEKLTLRANKLVLEPDELTIAYMSGYHKGVAVEREACAKVCDELHWPWHIGDDSGPKQCAIAIRARGEA
jgi:hypothetical protein